MGEGKRFFRRFLSALCGLALLPAVLAAAPVRNVIVMVPDGASENVATLAREYAGRPLALDTLRVGAVQTRSLDPEATDSAAAATAFATGHKTRNGAIGMGPLTHRHSTAAGPAPEKIVKPYATVLEAARYRRKATGLVARSRVCHATPAAFAAHVEWRGREDEIMEQMVHANLDVVFGGGGRHLFPSGAQHPRFGGQRKDGENLREVLARRGYQWVETESQMQALTSGRVWGIFSGSHMLPQLDRAEFAPTEPTLAEMTRKAIDLLATDPDGFFLLVEGSEVDSGCHANDPVFAASEFLAFDDAVRVACEFAARDTDTLVLVFPDHNTGGPTFATQPPAPGRGLADTAALLRSMKLTSAGLSRKIGADKTAENVRTNLLAWWGVDPGVNAVAEILAKTKAKQGLDYALSEVISRDCTVVRWASREHMADDVPLWALGPNRPAGTMDNTQLARVMAEAVGVDLEFLTGLLFARPEDYPVIGAYSLDTRDPANPVVAFGEARLPVNKDLLILGSNTRNMMGVVVLVPDTGRVYLPGDAILRLSKVVQPQQ